MPRQTRVAGHIPTVPIPLLNKDPPPIKFSTISLQVLCYVASISVASSDPFLQDECYMVIAGVTGQEYGAFVSSAGIGGGKMSPRPFCSIFFQEPILIGRGFVRQISAQHPPFMTCIVIVAKLERGG